MYDVTLLLTYITRMITSIRSKRLKIKQLSKFTRYLIQFKVSCVFFTYEGHTKTLEYERWLCSNFSIFETLSLNRRKYVLIKRMN